MPRRGRGVVDTYGAGLQTIDDWIANLRSLPELTDAAAPQVAEFLEDELRKAIREGRSLDGTKWAPTKSGKPPLSGAAGAIRTTVARGVVIIALTGHYVFHHFGFYSKLFRKRVPARPFWPTGGLPDRLGNAIRKGLVDMGHEWMTREGRHDRGSGGIKMRPQMGGG